MLLWTNNFVSIVIIEFFYGIYMAAEVAYHTYIYAKVDKKYYPKVSSYTRTTMFAGKMFEGILAQTLVYFKLMNYRQLSYVTLGCKYKIN